VQRANSARAISDRAVAYDIPGETIDGMDVLAVYQAVSRAAEHARSGAGPVLLDCLTYRYYGHSKSDRQLYRTKEEVQSWRQRDPIERLTGELKKAGLATEQSIAALKAEVDRELRSALDLAKAAPFPSAEDLGAFLHA